MRTGFVNILLLTIVLFSWEPLQASTASSEKVNEFFTHSTLSCLDCHSLIKENPDHPSFEESDKSCLECHDSFSGFPHNRRYTVNCMNCHARHHEKISHDAHTGISCEICHFADIKVEKKIRNNIPVWKYEPDSKEDYDPHRLTSGKEKMCSRCHFKGNNLGASSHSLPSKGIICMPCHAATFSIGDIPSAAAVIIFLTGIANIIFIWFSAGRNQRDTGRKKDVNFISVIIVIFCDVFLQRKLFKSSLKRWIIHEMIFLPLLFRFLLGLAALFFSLFYPEWETVWTILDKNNPFTGFIFDITGLLILMGGCLMIIEKKRDKKFHNLKELPKGNALMSTILGTMIITGFIVEGSRIAMTGTPAGSHYAFIGYGISRAMTGYQLNGLYAYLWYVHAFFTALFTACLPFSRMFHIFTAPLSLFIRGESGK